MSDEAKNSIVQELNFKIGDDISDLSNAEHIETELTLKRDAIQSSLNIANNEVPTKLSDAIKKAVGDTEDIEAIKERNRRHREKYGLFKEKWGHLWSEHQERFCILDKLEELKAYIHSFDKIHNIVAQMKNCDDCEQIVQLYVELKEQCDLHAYGHQTYYMNLISHQWHNILKDRLSIMYDEALEQVKWPFNLAGENPPTPKEAMSKFLSLTKCLFIIQEPDDLVSSPSIDEYMGEQEPCLPVRLLLRPIRKRFAFHFMGGRQTARIDRPEWFLTQTLIWIREHQDFVRMHIQPVADQLQMENVKAVDEFNGGLVKLAAERLYQVLCYYQSEDGLDDVDAAFAHAVDETLGFHRELTAVTEKESFGVLSVLTKANIFIQWLEVEKKYSLAKLDEMLDNEQWIEPCAGGAGAAAGAALWVPRGAALFLTLLRTIEDRYKMLPQPGHRLQFLELQLDLVEEWRIRLTQILSAAVASLTEDSFLDGSSPHPLTATVNAAHHTTTALLHLTHSLHYLQLHYYRRQFQQFTQQQHRDEDEGASIGGSLDVAEEEAAKNKEAEIEETMSLKEVEVRARKLALNEVSRQASVTETKDASTSSPMANMPFNEALQDELLSEESTVFGEAPALLAHLRDAGLTAIAEHILLEFKANLKEYKKQKWHSMPITEESALCISAALCRPLSGLCSRLNCANSRLAPQLTARLRADLAAELDTYMFQEVVLESWFNPGGTIQFTHDVKRNLVPAFAPPNKSALQLNQLPRLLDACKLLNMDLDEARRLRATLHKNAEIGLENLITQGIRYISAQDASQILSQRTDLSQTSEPASVLELF